MNKAVYHGILFALVVNVITGLIMIGITDVDNVPIFQNQDNALLPQYNENGTVYFTDAKNSVINPAGVTEDKGNLVFRLLDLIGLGFINQLITIVSSCMYGFVNLLENMFGTWMSPALFTFLFGWGIIPGALKALLTIAYVLAGIELWSNKSITD